MARILFCFFYYNLIIAQQSGELKMISTVLEIVHNDSNIIVAMHSQDNVPTFKYLFNFLEGTSQISNSILKFSNFL